jgi:hypothetical protein
VIARCIHDRDAGRLQPAELLQNKSLGFETDPVVVEQVAGDDKCVHLFGDGIIHCPLKRLPHARTQGRPHPFGLASEAGVKMNVGNVQNARHTTTGSMRNDTYYL